MLRKKQVHPALSKFTTHHQSLLTQPVPDKYKTLETQPESVTAPDGSQTLRAECITLKSQTPKAGRQKVDLSAQEAKMRLILKVPKKQNRSVTFDIRKREELRQNKTFHSRGQSEHVLRKTPHDLYEMEKKRKISRRKMVTSVAEQNIPEAIPRPTRRQKSESLFINFNKDNNFIYCHSRQKVYANQLPTSPADVSIEVENRFESFEKIYYQSYLKRYVDRRGLLKEKNTLTRLMRALKKQNI